jgi:uncharacterized membrane protein
MKEIRRKEREWNEMNENIYRRKKERKKERKKRLLIFSAICSADVSRWVWTVRVERWRVEMKS